ncbi:MAG: hypothetical protein HY314_12960 [Acidobacteria bacterium]|nr:hypothetical protein [Acidobacteriota bacterium]
MRNSFVSVTSKQVAARTLAHIRSLEATGALSHAMCYMLCLDREAYDIIGGNTSPSQVRPLSDEDVPEIKEFYNRPIRYLAFASKPYALRWALNQGGAERAFYLDSDTWFVKNPSFLFELLNSYDILLVPAIMSPEATIRDWATFARNAQRTGFYNAGFVGCHYRAKPFVEWWASRCAHSTVQSFHEDNDGDQKYLTWVPSLFSNVLVLRNNGLNIKPWITRYFPVERQPDGSLAVGGDPVVYFHFSQSLGNLTEWPPVFYPEVSQYLDQLERARIDAGRPYMDMSRRDNSNLTRLFLPRGGKLALVIKVIRHYQESVVLAKFRFRSLVARSAQFLPRFMRKPLVRRYLSQWPLEGDVSVSSFDGLCANLPKQRDGQPVVFLGVSRLAFYLAYLGYKVVVYDPFQGHFNRRLNALFNPQYSEAEQMRDLLALGSRLVFRRVPLATSVNESRPSLLFVSARREPDQVTPIVATLARSPSLNGVVALFDPLWPQEYRGLYRN